MVGNERFVTGEITNLNINESIAAASTGQFPQAVVLSCLEFATKLAGSKLVMGMRPAVP